MHVRKNTTPGQTAGHMSQGGKLSRCLASTPARASGVGVQNHAVGAQCVGCPGICAAEAGGTCPPRTAATRADISAAVNTGTWAGSSAAKAFSTRSRRDSSVATRNSNDAASLDLLGGLGGWPGPAGALDARRGWQVRDERAHRLNSGVRGLTGANLHERAKADAAALRNGLKIDKPQGLEALPNVLQRRDL